MLGKYVSFHIFGDWIPRFARDFAGINLQYLPTVNIKIDFPRCKIKRNKKKCNVQPLLNLSIYFLDSSIEFNVSLCPLYPSLCLNTCASHVQKSPRESTFYVYEPFLFRFNLLGEWPVDSLVETMCSPIQMK
jgi:hypothetical protein